MHVKNDREVGAHVQLSYHSCCEVQYSCKPSKKRASVSSVSLIFSDDTSEMMIAPEIFIEMQLLIYTNANIATQENSIYQ
jgi:hypothetical protein